MSDALLQDQAGLVVVPRLEQVVAWMSAMLDAQFVTLRMHPGLSKVLTQTLDPGCAISEHACKCPQLVAGYAFKIKWPKYA